MDWAPVMGPEKYGIATDGPAVNTTTELSSVVAPSARATSAGHLLSLDNPLTAFGLVAAFTFGLMAFSTSVRVGKTSASFNVGEA
jgi:hypothetical protein